MRKDGIYNVTIDEYHNGPGISRSGLFEFRSKSPLHYWHKYVNPEYKKPEPIAMITKRNPLEFGNAVHSYVLEKDKFNNEYAVWDGPSRVTKAGKEEWSKFIAENAGKFILDAEAFDEIQSFNRAIINDGTAAELVNGGLVEKSLYWTDKDTGMLCKARPDIYHSNMVVDLKTAADASPNTFERAIYQRGYHIQCAMIHEALKNICSINMKDFVFLVVEKSEPYPIGIYKLDEYALEQGVQEFKETLTEMKRCYDDNNWQSYPIKTLSIPNYTRSI